MPHQVSKDEVNSIIHAHSYDVHLKSSSESQRLVYRNTISTFLDHREKSMKDQSTSKVLTNDPYFNSTTSIIGDSKIFFPTPQLYDLSCSYSTDKNATCMFDKIDFVDDSIEEATEMSYRVRITHDAQKNSAEVRNYWVNAISESNSNGTNNDYDGVDSTTCNDNFSQVDTV